MSKKQFLFSLLLLLFMHAASANEFVVRYQILTSGTLFHIETKEGEAIGTIIRGKKNSAVHYDFYSFDKQLLATGITEKHFSDTIVRVWDAEGRGIGWFAMEIHTVYPSEYKVFNPAQALVAKGYMNWVGSSFILADPNQPKKVYVTFFRPMFKLFKDNWHFEIHQEGVIDFRLLCMVGVFQKACDLNFETLETRARD